MRDSVLAHCDYSYMRRRADNVKIWENRFISVLADLGLLVPTAPPW
jgi:hypothetical protein